MAHRPQHQVQSGLPEDGTPPDALIAAKVSLAQILINAGKDAEALKQEYLSARLARFSHDDP